MSEVNQNNLDSKYQIKSEIEHVLDRPGTWVGSTINDVINYSLFVTSKNKIITLPNIGYNAGLLKLVDEVLSNSVDEFRRKGKDALFPVTKIDVTVNNDGYVCIEDDGGIPVVIHKEAKVVIPELIFGHLRTSSNYDDSQQREGVGTNGLGAKLTNIFSKEFQVETADGKNSITINWSNNMRNIDKDLLRYPMGFPVIATKNHGTKTSFKIELERFDLDEMSLSTIRIIQRRCIDAAAANPGLIINFKSDIAERRLDSVWHFNNFKEYVDMYLDENQIKNTMYHKSKRDDIVIIPDNIGFNFGFVNGALCSEGTHIKKIEKTLTTAILEYCGKNDMELITEKDILNRMSIFVNCTIFNPAYESQSKVKLAHKIDKYALTFSNEFLAGLKDSALMQSLRDYYEIKYAEEKKKETRKLNATIKNTKTTKLISCASNSGNNELWLFEGNSASNGFRKHRNLFQAAYLLRGKIKNTFNLNKAQILENRELREVIATLCILFNEGQKNIKSCKYQKIVFATDMDYDGNHICGLLIAFFAKHFPELFKAGRVYRALSPIVIAAKKGQAKKYYYTLDELELDEKNLKGWELIYTKGLGGLDDEDYRQMLRQQKLIQFSLEDLDDMEAITTWFDKSTEMRKQLILEDNNELDAA